MIRYTLSFEDTERLVLEIDDHGYTSPDCADPDVPDWLLLERFRCGECPLPPGSRLTCPAAVAIRPVLEAIPSRLSYEKVQLEVERDEARLLATVSTQRAVRSLIGLLLPLSSCPIMIKLRPMAHLHLPLSGRAHTAFRFLGMHLIVQYLRSLEGDEAPDWHLEELLELFDQLHSVNRHLAERVRAATREDAAVNAVVLLDAFADDVAEEIEASLGRLRRLFAVYFDEADDDGPPPPGAVA